MHCWIAGRRHTTRHRDATRHGDGHHLTTAHRGGNEADSAAVLLIIEQPDALGGMDPVLPTATRFVAGLALVELAADAGGYVLALAEVNSLPPVN